jgi:LmbE family N-acetylglucosaminyl deacetylase
MKTVLLAVALTSAYVPAFAAKPNATKPPCSGDVCLNFHQQASIALARARVDVILLREEEYQKKIPDAGMAVMEKMKVARQEVTPLYTAALKSASGSPSVTTALKDYMKVWTAAINSYPMQTVKSTPEREAEHRNYETRLNDAWAEVQIESGI